LTAASSNPEGSFSVFNWDLDGDGAFNDATGPAVNRTFAVPGPVSIGLEAIQPGEDQMVVRQTVNVNGMPSAAAGGPAAYSVREGGSIRLVGSGSDPEAQPVAYVWDLNGDGSFETAGQAATFSALGVDGPQTRTVALRVCDVAGACVDATAPVRVLNVAPRVNAGPNRRVRRRARVRFRARITEPGPDSVAVRWTFGDRTRAARGRNVTHRFRRPGRYRVTVTVRDNDGGVSRDILYVRVRR
jgi:hypothetical protein